VADDSDAEHLDTGLTCVASANRVDEERGAGEPDGATGLLRQGVGASSVAGIAGRSDGTVNCLRK
jgi:hypothetical protein